MKKKRRRITLFISLVSTVSNFSGNALKSRPFLSLLRYHQNIYMLCSLFKIGHPWRLFFHMSVNFCVSICVFKINNDLLLNDNTNLNKSAINNALLHMRNVKNAYNITMFM